MLELSDAITMVIESDSTTHDRRHRPGGSIRSLDNEIMNKD